ncbi:MAG: hypothetical protein JSV97_05960 [candidate division WOR-3 bacterium]|nr:MAG: hypothetical protein JSV97_05960 [candidate division WOR-3 bacterium]
MKSAIATTRNELSRALSGSIQQLAEPAFFTIGEAGYSVMGRFKERPIIIDLYPYDEMFIRLDCKTIYDFQIVPNSFFARLNFLKDTRIFTRDENFDIAFVVRSRYYSQFASWLMHIEIRDSILSLTSFMYLMFKRNLLRFRTKIDFDHQEANEILNSVKILDTLAASLESLP